MTDKQGGPFEVRPNTLKGQSVPNTFGTRIDSGARQYLNSGGGNMAPPRRLALPQLALRVYVAIAVLFVFVALYLLTGTQ
ncbi:MAG: hypothetical protein ACXWYG_12360 [Aeromicrobium sp.]